MQTVHKCFISLILSYKVRKKTDLLRCNTNQAGTGHKLHFQPKIPGRAKLAAINNKNESVAQLGRDANSSGVFYINNNII